jgi:hypothetical protein
MQRLKLQPKIPKIPINPLVIIICGFFLFIFANPVFGAVLYLKSSAKEYRPGDVFIVKILLDTEKEYINTAKINLAFSKDTLEVKEFSKGNSILILWTEEPNISNQKSVLSFSGGIPGGYNGTDGLLGKIVFKAKKNGKGEIQFQETSQVLLNNGLGTKAKLVKKGITFDISTTAEKKLLKNEWRKEIKKDNIPPEIFKIEIHRNPAIFEGKYFITFSTTDKQTGVDHYEVQENKNWERENKKWKQATSPYLLEDQNLQSIIKVKAVDKAGNERIVGYKPLRKSKSLIYWLIVLILFIAGAVVWLIQKRKT